MKEPNQPRFGHEAWERELEIEEALSESDSDDDRVLNPDGSDEDQYDSDME